MKYRKLRIAWSVAWGIACLLLVALWVRSYHTADRLHGRLWSEESFLLGSKEGRVVAIVFHSHAPGWWQWETRSEQVDDELSFPLGPVKQYESWLGCGWVPHPVYMVKRPTLQFVKGIQIPLLSVTTVTLQGAGPIFPVWLLAVLCGTISAAPWIHWSQRFSLRTLLIGMTVAAIGLGVIVYALRK